MNKKMKMNIQLFKIYLILLLPITFISCRAPQTPQEYLDSTIDWIQENGVTAGQLNMEQVRAEAQAMAAGASTTPGTHEAIEYVMNQLPGSVSWFNAPEEAADLRHYGLEIVDSESGAIVVLVDPQGPAEKAGVAIGDRVQISEGQQTLTRDPQEPSPWIYEINPLGQTLELQIATAGGDTTKNVTISPIEAPGLWTPFGRNLVNGQNTIAYLNLTLDTGSETRYAPQMQELIASLDSPQTCGWIIDMRTNLGGDIWSYLAALGPFLGEGQMGGFQYADGRREPWERRDGRVYWDGEERYESEDIEADYQLMQANAPLAILTSPMTNLAAELAVVAFQGRDNVRTFGEPTRGHPHYQAVTTLSDGAVLSISGAFAYDRQGTIYEGKIEPHQTVPLDWQKIGQEDDPVVRAAQEWLQQQPACASP